jgi:hypothetical protein
MPKVWIEPNAAFVSVSGVEGARGDNRKNSAYNGAQQGRAVNDFRK